MPYTVCIAITFFFSFFMFRCVCTVFGFQKNVSVLSLWQCNGTPRRLRWWCQVSFHLRILILLTNLVFFFFFYFLCTWLWLATTNRRLYLATLFFTETVHYVPVKKKSLYIEGERTWSRERQMMRRRRRAWEEEEAGEATSRRRRAMQRHSPAC